MLGTLRRLAAAVASKFRKQPTPPPAPKPVIPLRHIRRFLSILDALADRPRSIPVPLHANGGRRPRVKGQKSRSQKVRSNRRKAAAKARVR